MIAHRYKTQAKERIVENQNGGSKIGTGTADGLMEFFDFLVAKGYATPAAVRPLKSASRQILSTVEGDDFGSVDLRNVDPDTCLDRFETMMVGQYKHESLVQYRNRFKRGLAAYLAYLDDKQIPVFGGPARKRRGERPGQKSEPVRSGGANSRPIPASTAERLIDYPFPLRSGQIAILRLPVGLDKTDAERMGAFIRTLVLDSQRELGRARTDVEVE
jgi:hypothetical protein